MGLEPTNGRLEVHRANHYTTDAWYLYLQIFKFLICMMRQKVSLCVIKFSEREKNV